MSWEHSYLPRLQNSLRNQSAYPAAYQRLPEHVHSPENDHTDTSLLEETGMTIKGGCLCGKVRYEIDGPLFDASHCHCSMCRRAHGAGYVTWVRLPRHQLRFLTGEETLANYRSSDHATRSFCRRCGSSLFFETTHSPDTIDVVLHPTRDLTDERAAAVARDPSWGLRLPRRGLLREITPGARPRRKGQR